MGQSPRSSRESTAPRLINAGYQIIPIKRGTKRPPWNGWEKRGDARAARQVAQGGPGAGRRRYPDEAPLPVDIDVRDDEVAKLVDDFVVETCGFAPTRVGQWPGGCCCSAATSRSPKCSRTTTSSPASSQGRTGSRRAAASRYSARATVRRPRDPPRHQGAVPLASQR